MKRTRYGSAAAAAADAVAYLLVRDIDEMAAFDLRVK